MGRQLFEYHPLLGYRFIPALRARVECDGGGYLVRVNQAGFRSDHEYVVAGTPGKKRALLFGDSYTAGNSVSNSHRFGDLLETLLPNLEVYNFGLPGSGTDQQYLTYLEIGRHLEYDLLILAPMVENIRRNVARYRCFLDHEGNELVVAKPYFELDADGGLALRHVPVPTRVWRAAETPHEVRQYVDRGGRLPWIGESAARTGGDFVSTLREWSRRRPLPAYDRATSPAWRLMKAILGRWVSESPAPVVICPLPLLEYIDGASADGYRARFLELENPPHIRVHDPLDALRRAARRHPREIRYAADPHPTPLVHQVLAESLAERIGPLLASRPAPPAAALRETAAR